MHMPREPHRHRWRHAVTSTRMDDRPFLVFMLINFADKAVLARRRRSWTS
ncbi:hypothetical protein HBB16_04770 [Pseudonocardia sp. MCCB 268]|nr:hypothetical protein [Pseudonocardia cytotoxica]